MIEFLRKILKLARPYRSRLILGILCGVASGLSSALLMGSVKIVVDKVFTDRESAEMHMIRNIKADHEKQLQAFTSQKKLAEAEQERRKAARLEEALVSLKTLSSNAPPEAEVYQKLAVQWNQFYEADRKENRDVLAKQEAKEVKDLGKLTRSAQKGKSTRVPLWLTPYVEKVQSWMPAQDTIKKNTAATVLIILLVPMAMFIRVTAMYLNIYLMNWVSIRAVTDLRNKLFAHLVNLDLSFFNKASTGELITRLNDVAVIQGTIGNSLSVIIRAPVTVIALGANLIYQQPKLTMVAFAVFPLCILPVVYYGRKAGKATELFQSKAIGLGKLMHETFTGNRIIKAYNLENTVIDQFSKTSREYIGFFMRMIRGSELPGPMIEFAGSVGIALFFMYIAFTGAQTPGDFLSFVGSLFLMYQPIKEITRLHTQLDHARVLSDGIFKLLETKTNVPEALNPIPLNATNPHITFKDVTFAYDPKLKPVLTKFNLTIQPGQMIALVGTTGSGKTTITNLLLRFYDPQSGSITINGVEIKQTKLTDLRRQIAVVTQDAILFNESIRHNIELGRPGSTRKEIEEAARHAHAFDFIMAKEFGFESEVGEKGALLSGGQKQRITIARAIVKDAPILILDEATNSLDAEVERIVQDALEELMVGRTTICIAHRLATIQKADIIIVMSEGQIVEMGRHGELLILNGHYKRLYDMQFQGDSTIEPMEPGSIRIGQVVIDKNKRTVTFPAFISMRQGASKYFIIADYCRTHESILRTESDPLHINQGVLLLNEKGGNSASQPDTLEGKPPLENANHPIPRYRTKLEMKWLENGKEITRTTEDMILGTSSKPGPREVRWIYNESRVYLGQPLGNIASIITDPDALLNNEGPGHDDDHIWTARTENLPPLNTPVQVTISFLDLPGKS